MSTDDSKHNRGPHLIDFQARECPRHHAIDDVPKKCYWKWKAVGFMPWWWRTTRLLTAVLLNVHERSAETFSLSIRCVLCAVVDVDASTYISTADADFNRDNKLWFPLPSFRALFFSTSFFPSLVAVYSFSFSFTLLFELTCSLTFNFIISKAFSHAELIELFTPEGTVVVRIKLHSWESERDRVCVISASDAQWRWEVH